MFSIGQTVPALATGKSFRLVLVSFWHFLDTSDIIMLILYFPCPCPGIKHSFTELWFLLLKDGI